MTGAARLNRGRRALARGFSDERERETDEEVGKLKTTLGAWREWCEDLWEFFAVDWLEWSVK